MLIAIPALVIGWIAYGMWLRKIRAEERARPKPQSQRLRKTKSEVSDWAQKMAQFQPPKPKRTYDDEGPEPGTENEPDKPE